MIILIRSKINFQHEKRCKKEIEIDAPDGVLRELYFKMVRTHGIEAIGGEYGDLKMSKYGCEMSTLLNQLISDGWIILKISAQSDYELYVLGKHDPMNHEV